MRQFIIKFIDHKGNTVDKGNIVGFNNLGYKSYEFIFANGKSEIFDNITLTGWAEIE